MRVVVQRVLRAEVRVAGERVGGIDEPGLCCLVGITHSDDPATVRAMAEKIWRLRIMPQEVSAADLGAPLLVVSQFTLYANTRKGRRPSWNAAAPAALSEPLVADFVTALRALGARIETGLFGALMDVELVNHGPVTIWIDSED